MSVVSLLLCTHIVSFLWLDSEFNFDSCVLSMEEFVFYYSRMDPRGVCLAFIDECDDDLRGAPYSILPLVRPTASNLEAAERLKRDGNAVLESMTNLASNLLKRPADRALPNREVIARDGLSATTKDADGDLALCRPTKVSRDIVNSIVDGAEMNKKSVDIRALNKLAKQELMKLAEEEGVSLAEGSKGVKQDYIVAIIESRYPGEEANVNVGATDEISTETVASVGTDGAVRNSVEYNLLMSMTKSKLSTLATKEKVIVKGASRASKKTFVDAILAARRQK